MTATCAPGGWVPLFQALLTPTVALIAVFVAYAQWWTARNRYKLDLFDRRWGVYVATRNILSAIFSSVKTSAQEEAQYLQGIRGARWLFNQEIENYLRLEVWKNVCDLNAANATLAGGALPQDQAKALDERQRILRWIIDQDVIADRLFGPFLQTGEGMIVGLRHAAETVRRWFGRLGPQARHDNG